jgi:nicotinate-nucleotide adenylyltransferase
MSTAIKRVAVFGGAFDPFHNGHVAAVRLLLSDPSISQVIIVPSGERPDKQGVSKATERLEMTRLGVQAVFGGDPRVAVSDVQSTGAVGFATIDLITYLRGTSSDQIEVVIGHELLKDLGVWNRADELKVMAHFLVLTRPGEVTSEPPPGWHVTFLPPFGAQGVDISSTALRARLASGDICQGLLPDVVRDYCRSRMLYQRHCGRIAMP